jgi:hypothetical protein
MGIIAKYPIPILQFLTIYDINTTEKGEGGGSPTEVGPVLPRSTTNSDNRLSKDSLLCLRIILLNQ